MIAIVDRNADTVAKYTYDAWGKVLSVTNASGVAQTSASFIGNINPIRYRGYYYDTDLGLYYLQSRYYDPETGRFVSVDNQISTGDMSGLNLFAYCSNDPVNNIDPTGEAWYHWALGAVVVAACAVAVVATAGGAAAGLAAIAAVGSGMAAATTASTIAAGAFIGAATVYGTALLVAASSSNSIEEFNAQGNWGTVAATAGGAVVGGTGAYVDTRTPKSSGSKLEKYIKNPQKIKNISPSKIQKIAVKENLQYGPLSQGTHAGQGFKVTWGGDRLLQYHPGGGHHGPNSYWKVSAGELGRPIRIFNDN